MILYDKDFVAVIYPVMPTLAIGFLTRTRWQRVVPGNPWTGDPRPQTMPVTVMLLGKEAFRLLIICQFLME
jgi:hypothetical protein